MNIRADQLAQQVSSARARGWAPIMRKAEKRHDLPAGLLLALASRETDMEDVVGDKGHGRGLFQIDDRFHTDWLAAHGAPGQGTTPRVADAADFAASMLASNLAFAAQNGIPASDQLRFACSAYNAGAGGALEGQQSGDCDRKTTGADYGRDVLERLGAIKPRKGGRSLQVSGDRILREGRPGPGRRPAQARAADVVRPRGSRRVADVPSQARAGVRCRAEHRRPRFPDAQRAARRR